MDEYAYLLQFVPNENPAIFILIFIQKVFYCDLFTLIQMYVNVLQIIINDIENEKVRCVYQNI